MKKSLLYITLVFLMISCGKEKEGNSHHHDNEESENTITLNPSQQKMTGIQYGIFEKQPIENMVKAPGYIDSPPQFKAVISPYMTVFIKEIRFITGDPVQKGQTVAIAESPAWASMQQEYLEALNQLENLRLNYERKKELYRDSIASAKEFQQAESEYQRVLARKNTIGKKLELMSTDMVKLNRGIVQTQLNITSPIEGKVSSVNTVLGKHIEPHEEIMEIVNEKHLHLEMKVYEKDVPKIKEGQQVIFRVPSIGNKNYRAHVYRVGSTISKKERYANVHAHLEQENEDLLPGMYINSYITVSDETVWSVSSEAVVREGNDQFVFVLKKREDKSRVFERKKIYAGLEALGYTELKHFDTSMASDSVVIEGAYYLSNALNEAGGHDH